MWWILKCSCTKIFFGLVLETAMCIYFVGTLVLCAGLHHHGVDLFGPLTFKLFRRNKLLLGRYVG